MHLFVTKLQFLYVYYYCKVFFLSFIPRIITITRSRYFWESEYIDAKYRNTILAILDKQTKREGRVATILLEYIICEKNVEQINRLLKKNTKE